MSLTIRILTIFSTVFLLALTSCTGPNQEPEEKIIDKDLGLYVFAWYDSGLNGCKVKAVLSNAERIESSTYPAELTKITVCGRKLTYFPDEFFPFKIASADSILPLNPGDSVVVELSHPLWGDTVIHLAHIIPPNLKAVSISPLPDSTQFNTQSEYRVTWSPVPCTQYSLSYSMDYMANTGLKHPYPEKQILSTSGYLTLQKCDFTLHSSYVDTVDHSVKMYPYIGIGVTACNKRDIHGFKDNSALYIESDIYHWESRYPLVADSVLLRSASYDTTYGDKEISSLRCIYDTRGRVLCH